MKLASRYKIGPIFTPPVVSTWPGPLGDADAAVGRRRRELAGRRRSIPKRRCSTSSRRRRRRRSGWCRPTATESDIAYITGTRARSERARTGRARPSRRRAGRAAMRERPAWRAGAGRPGAAAAKVAAPALDVQGLPLIKPPYGRITAIDLNKGDLVWQIAHGETPDNIKNHPALKGVTIPAHRPDRAHRRARRPRRC